MDCPNCRGKAISFGKLMTKMNPLRVECGRCGIELRANDRFIALFVVGLVASAALGFGLGWTLGNVVVAETFAGKILTVMMIALPIIIVFYLIMTFAVWKYGGYEVKPVYG